MWIQGVLLFILHCTVSTQHIRYVKPSDYFLSCPNQPCLTLEQYAEDASDQHFTTGTEFKFLAGNHSLRTLISLRGISNIAFTAEVSNSSDTINILCSDGCSIWCVNVTNLIVEGLTFVLDPSKVRLAFFQIFHGSTVLMNSLTIQRNEMFMNSSRATVYVSEVLLSLLRVVCL